ncbi:MAG: C40 family peptidase [Pseudolysinimonas sp.]
MAKVGRNTRKTAPEAKALEGPVSDGQIPAAFGSTKALSTKAPRRGPGKSSILSLAVTAVIVPGLFATVALPAYAFSPAPSSDAADASQALQQLKQAGAQTVAVDDASVSASVSRDAFSATSAAEMQRAALAAAYASYSGPSAADYLANPPYPNFDLAQVAAVAQQYIGTPYVYGGADPSGFDCSGFVMYVYAQFGIGLPHGTGGQAAAGTAISIDAAVPGDIVMMDGHDGFYMGNGMILDAGTSGTYVSIRQIWTSDYYIVRLGI